VTDYKVLNGQYGYYVKYLETYNIPLPMKYKKDISELPQDVVETAIKKFLGKKPAAGAKTSVSTGAKASTGAKKPATGDKPVATKTDAGSEPKKRGRKPKST